VQSFLEFWNGKSPFCYRGENHPLGAVKIAKGCARVASDSKTLGSVTQEGTNK